MDFRFYLSLFLRRLPWFLIVAVSVSAIGITVARLLPTVYVAQALLVVESEQIPDQLAASTVRTEATEQLQIIQQRILSRDVLVDMANRMQIYAPPGEGVVAGVAARPMDADLLVEDLRERIKIDTTGGSLSRGPAQATLVAVSFEAPRAALAAAVANDVVTLILKTDVEMRTGSARQTLDFFEQEVARLDKDLAGRGAQILKFKQANADALPDELAFSRTQLLAVQAVMDQRAREEAELRARRDRLVRLHNAAQASNGTLSDPVAGRALTPEHQQLRALKDLLTAQQAVLSPENPKIKLLQAQIAALETVVAAQAASGVVDDAGNQMSGYDLELADLDALLAVIAKQQLATQAQIAKLQTAINATPGNAIALDTLQRGYDNVKGQYDLAVTNKARAETGDTIETLSKGQRISVIEQAVAPTEPDRPNRAAIAVGGVVGGLALGLALVVLIEFLQAGIRRPAEVTARLGIAVFATLPYMKTAREIRWRRLRLVLTLIVLIGTVAAALWAIDTYYMPLDLLLDQIIKRLSLLAVPTVQAG